MQLKQSKEYLNIGQMVKWLSTNIFSIFYMSIYIYYPYTLFSTQMPPNTQKITPWKQ